MDVRFVSTKPRSARQVAVAAAAAATIEVSNRDLFLHVVYGLITYTPQVAAEAAIQAEEEATAEDNVAGATAVKAVVMAAKVEAMAAAKVEEGTGAPVVVEAKAVGMAGKAEGTEVSTSSRC